jgi:hypothetical protein
VVSVTDPYGRILDFLDRKKCSQANKIETKVSIVVNKLHDIMLILGTDNTINRSMYTIKSKVSKAIPVTGRGGL